MADTQAHRSALDDPSVELPDHETLVAEMGDLHRRLEALRSQLDRIQPAAGRTDSVVPGRPTTPAASSSATPATSRRRLLHLAGASAVGAVGGAMAARQPVSAADPNDVVKNVSNSVDNTTTLDGAFTGPVLSLFNRSSDAEARGLYVSADGAQPSLRVDNDRTAGAVGLAGNAPAGVDLLAMGSGRIAMDDHVFGGDNEYTAGEIHQSGGTFYAMVHDGFRRVIASPEAAGALFPIEPIRVYDSRAPLPEFGRIAAGQSRSVDINDARDRTTGEVAESGVVPEDATAVVFNLTVAQTEGRGYLSVTPETVADPDTSMVNWWTDDAVVANSSMVGIGIASDIAVYCGGTGSTHFIVDVMGYYR